MKGFVAILLIITAFTTSSCEECLTCESFNEEPFLKVRFFNQADSSKRVIIIDSVNQIFGQELKHFQDTTYEYRFALDMHHDTSVYHMVYRDTSNLTTYLANEIMVIYSRQFLSRDDNYIIVECNLDSFTADFAEYELICKDSSNIECISNEAVAKIYN
jgi:hypothetical protein